MFTVYNWIIDVKRIKDNEGLGIDILGPSTRASGSPKPGITYPPGHSTAL